MAPHQKKPYDAVHDRVGDPKRNGYRAKKSFKQSSSRGRPIRNKRICDLCEHADKIPVNRPDSSNDSESDNNNNNNNCNDESVKKNEYERDRLDKCLDWTKQFWKIGRPVYNNETSMCKECHDYNYALGDDRFEVDDVNERLIYKQSICKKCVLRNIDIANRHLHHENPHYPDNYYKNAGKN